MAREDDSKRRRGPVKKTKHAEPPPYDPDPRLITEFERSRRRIEEDHKKIFRRDPGAEARRLARKKAAKETSR